MKQRFFNVFALSSVLAFSLTNCGSSNGDSLEMMEYIPVKTEQDGKWGMLGKDNKVYLEDEFKNEPSAVINGIFSVEEENGYTLYKFDKKKPTPIKNGEDLISAGYCQDGLIPVAYKHSRITIINNSGDKKAELLPVKGKEIVESHPAYQEGMLAVKTEDNLWGFVDTKGSPIVAPKYNYVMDYSDGVAIVTTEKDDKTTYTAINKKGEKLFDFKSSYTPMGSFRYGKVFANDGNDHVIILDKKGEVSKLNSKVAYVRDWNEKNIVFVNSEGNCGVIDYNGEILVRAKYKDIQLLPTGNFLVLEDDEASIMNHKGDVVKKIDDAKEGAAALGEFGIFARDGKLYQLYNNNGEIVKNAEFTNYGLNKSLSYRISSDYFNMEGMAQKVAELISDNGVGKYKLNANPSTMFSNPYDHRYSELERFDELTIEGFKYSIKVLGYFSSSIAISDYDSYYYSSNYKWNPDSKLESLLILVEAESDLGSEAVTTIAKVLSSKGFKDDAASSKDDMAVSVLSKGSELVVITTSGSMEVNVQIINDSEGIYKKYLIDAIKSNELNSSSMDKIKSYKYYANDNRSVADTDTVSDEVLAAQCPY